MALAVFVFVQMGQFMRDGVLDCVDGEILISVCTEFLCPDLDQSLWSAVPVVTCVRPLNINASATKHL